MKKSIWFAAVLMLIISACGSSATVTVAPTETVPFTETPIALLRFVTPLDGAAVDYNEMHFQIDSIRVRSKPSKTGEIIGQLYPGAVSLIIEGPACADGLVYWKVENSAITGGSGWTAEGDGKEYWLQPYQR